MYIGKTSHRPVRLPLSRAGRFLLLFSKLSLRFSVFLSDIPISRIIPVFLSDIPFYRIIPVFLSDILIFPDHSGFSFRYLGFPRIIPVFLFKVLLVPPGGVRPAHRSRGRSYPRGRVHLPFWGQRPDKKELCGTGFSNGNPDPLEHIH